MNEEQNESPLLGILLDAHAPVAEPLPPPPPTEAELEEAAYGRVVDFCRQATDVMEMPIGRMDLPDGRHLVDILTEAGPVLDAEGNPTKSVLAIGATWREVEKNLPSVAAVTRDALATGKGAQTTIFINGVRQAPKEAMTIAEQPVV